VFLLVKRFTRMFGIPTEIISMGASTLLGAWIKIKSQKSADRAAQHLQLINRHSTIEQGVQNARQDQSWGTVATRRFIVLCLMTMAFVILAAPFFDIPTNVLVENQYGVDVFLFDLTFKVKEYVTLNGMVAPDWLSYAILNVIGFYFGASVAKR